MSSEEDRPALRWYDIYRFEQAIKSKSHRTKNKVLAFALEEIQRLTKENRRLMLETEVTCEVENGLNEKEKEVADMMNTSWTTYYLHKKMIEFMKTEDRLLNEIKRLKELYNE